ncbi:MAG: Abi family protein [Spirochaetia bacterium]|nr:Abi family protein [Spirochaetia bacterium]
MAQNKKQYDKPPLPLNKQADLLLSRGLDGISKEELIKKLSNINYYRFRGYTYPYQNNDIPNCPFKEDARWEYIWNDYVFDSKLSNLITEALGHIEVAIRTQLELEMSLDHGSRWYTDSTLCHNEKLFSKNLAELNGHWERSREVFKEHYIRDYDTSLAPPAWMIFETTTFGTVSKIYSNIKASVPAKTRIANYFGFSKSSTKVLISWLQHLNLVRNICAHYSRLFSRSFIVKPMLPKTYSGKWIDSIPAHDRIYISICIITYFLDICAPEYDFKKQLKEVMAMCRTAQLQSIGFPLNWQEQNLFK